MRCGAVTTLFIFILLSKFTFVKDSIFVIVLGDRGPCTCMTFVALEIYMAASGFSVDRKVGHLSKTF